MSVPKFMVNIVHGNRQFVILAVWLKINEGDKEREENWRMGSEKEYTG